MFANEICPYQSHAEHREKSCDALHITHMGVLDVKAGRFHGSESRFYLPSLFVCQNRVLGAVEAYENLQFRNSFGVFDSTAGKIDILTFVKKELMEEFLLTDLQIIEQPPCTDSLNGGGLDIPEVLTYSDVIPYATAVEPSCPFLPDEFAVCHKAVDTFRSEKTDKAFHNLLAFLPVGVATFREKVEYQREGNPFIGDAQHENVDIELSELPVGAIHAEHKTGLDRKQRENHTGYDVKVKNILGKESLETSEVGILVDSRRHRISQFVEADSLHHTECVEQQRHKFYACQIHILSKMLLHNREDLVNFDRVLEISSFHEKKCPNFSFKLLNFKDFYKFNHLKIKCLTV